MYPGRGKQSELLTPPSWSGEGSGSRHENLQPAESQIWAL